MRVTDNREGVFVTTDSLTMGDFNNVAQSVRKVLRDDI